MNKDNKAGAAGFLFCPWTIKDVFIVFIYSLALFLVLIFWMTAAYFLFSLFVKNAPYPFGSLKTSVKDVWPFWIVLFFYAALFISLKIKIFNKYKIREWEFFVRRGQVGKDVAYGIMMYLKFLAALLLVSFLSYLVATMWDMVFRTAIVERINLFFIASKLEKSAIETEAKNIGIISISIFFVFAPFFEELFFRGCLYTALRKRSPVLFSAVASSFIFSLLHGYFFLFSYVFFVGLLLAYMYEKRRSLVAPLTFHMLNNLAVMLLLFI